MSETLVIIDMQPSFYHARAGWLIENLQYEIRETISRKGGIIFVEYDGMGNTLPELMRVARKYPMCEALKKQKDCGAAEVLDIARSSWYNTERMKFGGVNTDVCVAKTVRKLAKTLSMSNLTVLKHCCNGPVADFSWTEDFPNIFLERGTNDQFHHAASRINR